MPAFRTEWRSGAVHSAELMFAFDSIDYSSWAANTTGKADSRDRAVAKRVNSCWVAFFKMEPKAKSLTCADGFTWAAYTEAGDDAAQFRETPALVKSKTIPDAPPAAGRGAAPSPTVN